MNKLSVLVIGLSALAACQQAAENGNQSAAAASQTPSQGSASATGGTVPQQRGGGTIAATLGGSADHSSLVQALKSAGLSETLAGAGPYTVFAPTNTAFQKLPQGTAEAWARPESKGALTGILTYHVVPGVVTAKDLAAAVQRGGGKTQLATMAGGTLTATEADGGIVISDASGGRARVTQADLVQTNGVVHSIDAVLMPKRG